MSFLKRYVGCQHYRVLLEGGTPRQARYKTGFCWAGVLLLHLLLLGFMALDKRWLSEADAQRFTEFFILDQDDVTHFSRLVLTLLLALGGLVWLLSASPVGVAYQQAARQEVEQLEAPTQQHVVRSLRAFRRLVFAPGILLYFLAYKL